MKGFQAFSRFRQRCHWTLEVFFPQYQWCSGSALNVVFTSWTVKFIVSVFSRFHCPKCFCLFDPCRLVQLSAVIVQGCPFFSFNSFLIYLTKGVRVRIHQRRLPLLELNMFLIDEGSQRTHFFSSQGQFVSTFSDDRLCEGLAELRFLHLDRLGASVQATHIHSTVVVYLNEVPEPIDDACTTSPVQTCDDAFNRAICWFARSFNALTRLSHSPSGAACA